MESPKIILFYINYFQSVENHIWSISLPCRFVFIRVYQYLCRVDCVLLPGLSVLVRVVLCVYRVRYRVVIPMVFGRPSRVQTKIHGLSWFFFRVNPGRSGTALSIRAYIKLGLNKVEIIVTLNERFRLSWCTPFSLSLENTSHAKGKC